MTEYLVDATRGSAVTRNVHAVGGVLSEQNQDGTWEWLLRDGLGSVRSVTDAAGAVLETVDYSPYGVPNAALTRTVYGFTGEMTDTNGRVYLRARYYHPTLGTFPTLDPFEGVPERPLSLHGYSYANGNPVTLVDLRGLSASVAKVINGDMCSTSLMGLAVQVVQGVCSSFDCCLVRCSGNTGPVFSECMDMCGKEYVGQKEQSITILFGGSQGGNLFDPGPDPAYQTPVWFDIADKIVPYPGVNPTPKPSGKQGQADLAAGHKNSNLFIIGYSAGADAALIFADQYRKIQQSEGGSGRITDIAILGGTMTGAMHNGKGLDTEWQRILNDLLETGTDVYILDDNAGDDPNWADYKPPVDVLGSYNYQSNPDLEHWDGSLSGQLGTGTNNDPLLRDRIIQWLLQH